MKLKTGFRQPNMQLIVVLAMRTMLPDTDLEGLAIRSPDRVKLTKPRGGL
ncbi:hypothetical protein [Agrobacterium tumefaciens]|nr:hypothetical protein [Agrobacterium tumefaciens]WCK04446.1 hypothetical protein G6L31_017575 [Agrobacterium tumefaciens]